MRKYIILAFAAFYVLIWLMGKPQQALAQTEVPKTLWQIGKPDHSDTEFALAPSGYKDFLDKDFGWENKFYLIGLSNPKTDWPYALPGPFDEWGGSSGGAGWRAAVENILFGITTLPDHGNFELNVGLLDMSAKHPPKLKITVNDTSWEFHLPKGSGDSTLKGAHAGFPGYTVHVALSAHILKKGGNEISITTLWGSWLVFDYVSLQGPEEVQISKPENAFIRNVKAADYEITRDNKPAQPLLIDVQHLTGDPVLTVYADHKKIFEHRVKQGRYVFEAPMPAVKTETESHYEIKINNRIVRTGMVLRSPQKMITPAGYVNTMLGSAHSRWMIAPGPWMPFGMVKLSPDNQNAGWDAGYDPIFENVGGFSHIHEWTMSGLSMLPVNGPLITQVGDQEDPASGYRSAIDKRTEEAPLGYYKVHLLKYNIWAELTATTRCSFQRYTYPREDSSRILVDFTTPAEYNYQVQDVEVKKIDDHTIEGFSKQFAPDVWGKGIDQNYTIHFYMQFDQPIKDFGYWIDSTVTRNTSQLKTDSPNHAGVFIEFNTANNSVVQVRTGMSYVSIQNAKENLEQEITKPFGWNFDSVRQYNVDTWNDLLDRIKISTDDRREKIRFYTNVYRALSGRNIYSDVNGQWIDATGQVQQLKDSDALTMGCDAFWNTFWNLNQLWNLAYPDWSSRWVRSQLAMYDANGALAKGPAGMKYIPVMVAEHEIPLIVGAYQMGIRNYDVRKAFEAVKKMETTPAWKIGHGLAGNRDLVPFLQYHYVPYDKGRFSNTLEYAYDNWTVAQFAKVLGKETDYTLFSERGSWWKNAINRKTGYAQMRKSDGTWKEPFDPFRTGQNAQYVEGNAWQLTYFVPQNVPALMQWIGKDTFINRLNNGFEESYGLRFNAPAEQYWEYPVDQGNEQSMQFAFLFNYAGKPWLTQKWSRALMDRYYGYGLSDAYLGDEDQGQMSGWFVMAAIGLFQVDGGCSVHPTYGIASPLYKKVTINLGGRFGRGSTFTIIANHASRKNRYIQSAVLNGKKLNSPFFPASELLKGGSLILQMGPEPDKKWGTGGFVQDAK